MNEEIISLMAGIAGADFVITEDAEKAAYGKNHTDGRCYPCDLVVKPGCAREVAEVLGACSRHRVPVTPRGGGTGVTGGALPLGAGIVLSMERLNRIERIDPLNRTALVEAGVITEHLQQAAFEKGLFFPPEPGSKGSCFIGGNIAMSAGGPRSAKYGTVKDYVLNLEVALPDGNLIWTGADVTKNASGLHLTQLFVGSEGILGIITKAVLKLIPYPAAGALLFTAFRDVRTALEALEALVLKGMTPACAELIYDAAFIQGAGMAGASWSGMAGGAKACLLLEVDAGDGRMVAAQCEAIAALVAPYTSFDVMVGDTYESKKQLWSIRDGVVEFLSRSDSRYRDIDVCVPRSELPRFISGTTSICREYGLETICFGHALDGNIHVMVLNDRHGTGHPASSCEHGIQEIYRLAAGLGGVISGEHGIGYIQKEFFQRYTESCNLALMRSIKKVFDPHHILNPGKVF